MAQTCDQSTTYGSHTATKNCDSREKTKVVLNQSKSLFNLAKEAFSYNAQGSRRQGRSATTWWTTMKDVLTEQGYTWTLVSYAPFSR
jgi:hypothetical protein